MSQLVILRTAAFLVDTLLFALILILPATLASWIVVVTSTSSTAVTLVWYGALLVFMLAVLFRDGLRGRSLGKLILGLELNTRSGRRCGPLRSAARNLPLLIPGWNLIELYLVLFGSSGLRTGDRMSGTRVVEE